MSFINGMDQIKRFLPVYLCGWNYKIVTNGASCSAFLLYLKPYSLWKCTSYKSWGLVTNMVFAAQFPGIIYSYTYTLKNEPVRYTQINPMFVSVKT